MKAEEMPAPAGAFDPQRILVVDDEPDLELLIRQRFRNQIREGKYDFLFALNGVEALARLEENPAVGVVFTDINMPVMDGLALLSRIADLNRMVETVILSAYDDMQNIRTAMNRGAYDFLTKPINFGDFESTLLRTIEALEARRSALEDRDQLWALRHELEVATKIQQSILPRTFPPFPKRREIELFAQMIPARQVSGDFYDFFFQDENRLVLVIGDVSGKGIPAAIFMAVSRTLLRATALREKSPVLCLESVNQALASQSQGEVFVTIFLGILDLRTGEMEYSVGGQNPPYFLTPSQPPRALSEPTGLMVGLFEDARYESGVLQLHAGDCLVLYTDGIPEAENAKEELFTAKRLQATLAQVNGAGPQAITERIIEDVREFANGVQQIDDMTVLAVRFLENSQAPEKS